VGVVTNRQLAARRRTGSRRIERLIREAESRTPGVAERLARIRAATRAGRAAVKSRQEAQTRLTAALRRLIRDGLSIREAAERLGVAYHEARQLIRAAELADKHREPA
jgi:plasmid maintenance system antidote protein VapI